MIENKICPVCSVSFLPKTKVVKYCSTTCQHQSMRRTKPVVNTIERLCVNPSCDLIFTVKVKSDKKKYCSHSCAAQVNNVKFPKRENISNACKKCGVKVKSGRSFCDLHVASLNQDRKNAKIQAWLSGEWNGSQANNEKMSRTLQKFLLEQADYKCSACGFNTPHPVDGSSVLEIDHINGDGTDHSPSNLRVLCPNCHALTPTYRGRNLGKGKRTVHYIRVSR